MSGEGPLCSLDRPWDARHHPVPALIAGICPQGPTPTQLCPSTLGLSPRGLVLPPLSFPYRAWGLELHPLSPLCAGMGPWAWCYPTQPCMLELGAGSSAEPRAPHGSRNLAVVPLLSHHQISRRMGSPPGWMTQGQIWPTAGGSVPLV